MGCSPWGGKELDKTDTHTHTHTHTRRWEETGLQREGLLRGSPTPAGGWLR